MTKEVECSDVNTYPVYSIRVSSTVEKRRYCYHISWPTGFQQSTILRRNYVGSISCHNPSWHLRTLSRLFREGGEKELVSIYSLSMINPSKGYGIHLVCTIVCVPVYLLPRFLPPHATSWPKSDTNGFTLHWLDFTFGGFHKSTAFNSYSTRTKVASQYALAYIDRILPVLYCGGITSYNGGGMSNSTMPKTLSTVKSVQKMVNPR